jgi:class 3 adenylate cyclase
MTPGPILPEVASEAIVVVDLVEATGRNNLFGWYAVGRGIMRDLRAMLAEVAGAKGLSCLKSTGDGYLLTFVDKTSAESAAVHAIEAAFALLARMEERNRELPDERAIHLRFAVHFGEVDVVQGDREGPHVSYAFRIEGISRASVAQALNPIPPESLPLRNYVLCSEEVAGILERRSKDWGALLIGLFKLKGFSGWREVFLVLPTNTNLDGSPIVHGR